MEIKELLSKYNLGYDCLSKQLDQMPEAAIVFSPSEDKWSIAKIIIHLSDSEMHGFLRIRKIVAECGERISVYNKQIWADNLFYDQMDYKEALEMIRIARKNNYKMLTLIPEEIWHNYIYHPESGKLSLYDCIRLYNDHINIHLQQIQQNYCDWKKVHEKKVGFNRFFRGIEKFLYNTGKSI